MVSSGSGSGSGSASAPMRILFVCTGNICRSPMGQAMLTARFRADLGDDASRLVEVTSAGTYGLVGHPIEPDALAVLGELGVAADEFAARELSRDIAEAQDLVLTATREHRAAAVSMLPRASRWTFTIREFARLVEAVDVAELLTRLDDDAPAVRGRALVDAAASQRGYVRPASPSDDDVADPYRRPIDAFRIAAQQIDTSTRLIADRLVQVLRAG
ncbi:MAG TPA: hypothetical protein VFJ17_15235 [Mycobacteriales bacterium]|jgi:protein-tyrosine phosphatase|nr:hypothetical protein [Mycobacteriales bacterium]